MADIFRKFIKPLTEPQLGPQHILLFALVLTSSSYLHLTNFGLTRDDWWNFYAWHFAHRTFSHWDWNLAVIVAYLGTGIAISFAELTILSAFVYSVTFLDPVPFYGLSGITFFLLGRSLDPRKISGTYLWLGIVKVPYLLLVLFACWSLASSRQLPPAVEFYHGFAFFFGAIVMLSEYNTARRLSTLSLAD